MTATTAQAAAKSRRTFQQPSAAKAKGVKASASAKRRKMALRPGAEAEARVELEAERTADTSILWRPTGFSLFKSEAE